MQKAIVNFVLVVSALLLCSGVGVAVYMIAT
jgi:phage shock protein PspC (stress-responsive transcriptional regulator)